MTADDKNLDDMKETLREPSGAEFEKGMPIPSLRQLQIEQVQMARDDEEDGEPVVILKDPEGWCSEPSALSPGAFAVAALFDDKKSSADVKAVFKDKYGQEIDEDQILLLAKELDKSYLLASEEFEEHVRKVVLKYLVNPVRPGVFSGSGYPKDPAELLEYIESFFTVPGAPGSLPNYKPAAKHQIKGMIVPHIDLKVGQAVYAHGYKKLIEHSQADLFVILGVAHKGQPEVLFNVSAKDQATPFGPVKAAKGISQRLQERTGVDKTVQEFAHRSEFSVEFQAIMLNALLGQRAKREFEIVPIVCGSVESFITSETNPADEDAFKRFVDATRDELEKSNRKWCLLASVDFSHVGPEFEHSTAITERVLPPIERGDQRLLSALAALKRDAFYNEIARTQNARNVDAVMASMALLSIGEGSFKKGELLSYHTLLKDQSHSAVSYASMAFS